MTEGASRMTRLIPRVIDLLRAKSTSAWTAKAGTSATTRRRNASIPNIASILKTEVSRVARKEVRAEIETLKKASVTHRS